MKNQKKHQRPAGALLPGLMLLLALLLSACGSDSNPTPPDGDHDWWSNYLDGGGQPITLPSGFKLAPIEGGSQRTAGLVTTPANPFAMLNFAVDPRYRSNRGWLFRGHDQLSSDKQDLAGAAELVKQEGWLRIGETFDWDNSTATYNQPPLIRLTFQGFAGDLMIVPLSQPYIAYPTDTTQTWLGPETHVSNGGGQSFTERLSYTISYLGARRLVERTGSGERTLNSYPDVILIRGRANQGQGAIEACLAPNVGIIYYHLTTAFGQEGAAALIGFSGDNRGLTGAALTDYFPTAAGNHWVYEFSPDEQVPQFRFSVKE